MTELCPICGKPKEFCLCEEQGRETQKNIQVYTVVRKFGKLATIIDGIDPGTTDLDGLAKQLKTKLACGGTVKEGRIELQGNHKRRIVKELEALGFPGTAITVK